MAHAGVCLQGSRIKAGWVAATVVIMFFKEPGPHQSNCFVLSRFVPVHCRTRKGGESHHYKHNQNDPPPPPLSSKQGVFSAHCLVSMCCHPNSAVACRSMKKFSMGLLGLVPNIPSGARGGGGGQGHGGCQKFLVLILFVTNPGTSINMDMGVRVCSRF